MVSYYLAFGQDDLAVIAELPDNAAATTLAVLGLRLERAR